MTPSPFPQIEKHFTINELTDVLNMSFERVRQLVMNEPGVLVIPPSPSKRRTSRRKPNNRPRHSYRIPASVVQRLMRRYAVPMAA